jgi:hypothetical protein
LEESKPVKGFARAGQTRRPRTARFDERGHDPLSRPKTGGRMRKYLAIGVGVLAALAVANFAFAGSASSVQTITTKLTPKKMSKKKYKPAKIFVDIETQNNDEAPGPPGSNEPPKANRTVVDFPKNMKFDSKAVPKCKVGEGALQNTTTDQAKQLCGPKSVVSVPTTNAVVGIGSATGTQDVPVDVTAFNGNKPNTLYLHAKVTTLPITSILVGKLKKGPKGYGRTLDVKVPQLAAGGIASFKTTVKAGKYVQARCKTKNMTFRATSTYLNHSKTVDTYSTKCKQKK